MTRAKACPQRWGETGQGLVEFALVLPVFMFILFGLFDVGKLVYTNATLSNAAREGARLAAAEAGWIGRAPSTPSCVEDSGEISGARPGAHVCPEDVSALKAHVADAVEALVVAIGPVSDVHISCNAGDAGDMAPAGDWTESAGGNGCLDDDGSALSLPGGLVSVRVEYTYETFTPLVSSLIGDVSLSASASMVIN
jgi:hypothetical protein